MGDKEKRPMGVDTQIDIAEWGEKDITGMAKPGQCVVKLPGGGTIDVATLKDPFQPEKADPKKELVLSQR